MSELKTIFEISPYANGVLAQIIIRLGIGIILIFAGTLSVVRSRKIFPNDKKQWLKSAKLLFVGMLWLSTNLIFLRGFPSEFSMLLDAYRSGKSEVVEGRVHVLHAQPENGHTKGDIISINGHTFEVNYYQFTMGYKQTIAHRGALKEGVFARVHCLYGVILKVETLDEPYQPREGLQQALPTIEK